MSGDDMEKKYRLFRLDNREVPENDICDLKDNPSIIVSDYPYEYCHGFLSFHGLEDIFVIAEAGKVIFRGNGFPPEFFDRDDDRNLDDAIALVERKLF